MQTVNESNAGAVAAGTKNGRPGECGPASVRRSASIANIAAAMCKAQAGIDDPTKNKKADAGGRGSYRYADLPTVLDVVRPALSANGLAVMQFPCELDGHPAVTTLLAHTSGEWVEAVALLRPVKSDPQGIGSALTYMKRYSLLSLCGIAADDDDDGAAASRPQQAARPAANQSPSNPAVRDAYARDLEKAATRAAVDTIIGDIRGDVQAGVLTQADAAVLRPLCEKSRAKFPAADTAGAKA